ncbi:hypothetical protein PENVUL_c011G02804 [Penicillium vulpinum]|uniref:Uncharacterized protein n=2 Tax=Penicillium vulpinum TaxID=29845 RepID=A0A1V6S2Y6_9EURO|nr:hypothetical protein PENVUL_c011G02804 [Penicillium vulpinum]
MADFLLKHGADVNAEFKTLSMGEWSPALPTVTPLDLAVGRGNSVMTLLLLQNGAKMRDGITLSRAIEHGAILAWINTESPGYWDDDGFEAPGVAPKYDFRTVVEVLNLYGADINQDCLLHYAVECYGSLDDGVIEHLLFLGANVHAKDSSGFSVISYAFEAEENTTQRIKAFVELLQLYGAKVDPEELHGPLQNAILSRDLEYLELVLDYGADVNFLYDGGTYLHLAITHLAYDVDDTIQEKFVKALLNRGADVLLRNTESKTPLELAMSFSWKKNIAKLLLDAGAKVQCQGKEGTRLLNCLIVDDLAGRFYPDTNRLQYYLEAMETDPSEFESHHDFSDVDDMIGLLLEYGARPDYVDDSGQCPLDQQGAKLFSALHPWLSKRKGA